MIHTVPTAGGWQTSGGGRAMVPCVPPRASPLGEDVDGVVVRVAAGDGVRVVGLEGRPVVLRPPADAAHPVVLVHLVHPPLADEGDVAHDPRGGESGQVPYDPLLQVLCIVERV